MYSGHGVAKRKRDLMFKVSLGNLERYCPQIKSKEREGAGYRTQLRITAQHA